MIIIPEGELFPDPMLAPVVDWCSADWCSADWCSADWCLADWCSADWCSADLSIQHLHLRPPQFEKLWKFWTYLPLKQQANWRKSLLAAFPSRSMERDL